LCLRTDPEKLLPEFAKYLIRSPAYRARLASFIKKAVNQASVSIGHLKTIRVFVPTLSEQRRIAEILDTADALRAKRRAALAQLETLTQSMFLDMFGDPAKNPKGWPLALLGARVSTTSGGTPNRDVDAFFGGGIPWVKSGELHQGVVTTTDETLTDRGLAESSAKLMKPGTVLVAMYGATVGAVALLGIEAATNQAICCITPTEEVHAAYLIHLLRRLAPSLLAKRVGGAQPNLSQDLIRRLSIPLPSPTLQVDFAKRVAAVAKARRYQEASLSGLNAVFASLQQRAFSGEL
jgi:type I restriction enzyme, S subunit